MHTECPFCHTIFNITAEQLAISEGFARCGNCYETFNAQASLIDAAAVIAVAPPEITHHDLPTWPRPPPPIIDHQLLQSINLAEEALQHSTRTALEQQQNPTSSHRQGALAANLWSLGCVALLALFLTQYSYFYRHELSQYPPLRPWLEGICRPLNCHIPLLRSPQLIHLQSQELRTLPDQPHALRVRATLRNTASYPQAYPLLQLDLTNITGTIIATRRFTPAEYHSAPLGAPTPAIKPQEQVDIALDIDIAHLPTRAIGFTLQFL